MLLAGRFFEDAGKARNSSRLRLLRKATLPPAASVQVRSKRSAAMLANAASIASAGWAAAHPPPVLLDWKATTSTGMTGTLNPESPQGNREKQAAPFGGGPANLAVLLHNTDFIYCFSPRLLYKISLCLSLMIFLNGSEIVHLSLGPFPKCGRLHVFMVLAR